MLETLISFAIAIVTDMPAEDISDVLLERVAERPAPVVQSVEPAQAPSHYPWDSLAQCESNGQWNINTGNGFEGGLQFLRSTWLWMGGDDFASAAHLATREEQIIVAERLVAHERAQGRGGFNPWPACADKLGLPR